MSEQNLSLPEDITTLSDDALNEFTTGANARFDELFASETDPKVDPTTAQTELAEMDAIATSIEKVDLEKGRRVAEVKAATDKRTELASKMATLRGKTEDEPKNDDTKVEATAEVVTAAAERPVGGATTTPIRAPKLNPSLADGARHAPKLVLPRREPVLIASADIPGYANGSKLDNIDALVAATVNRARSLPVTRKGDDAPRYPVASLLREHKFNLGLDSTPAEVNEVLLAAANPDILVAAGGWCSPSEISYDFFNIVCEDGMLDLPTVGINRGGIRWPTSPSFADVVSSQALWRWTETQDIAAVTGTAQSGTKTCGRVPCADFNEERLDCDGICLTVGNLTEDAYPEMIANFKRLLFAAHAHKVNGLRVEQLRTLSSAFTVTNGAAGSGVVAPVLGALELQAIDYRERYAMCENSVIEVIAPRWLRGAMRSDLRKRMGAPTDQLSMSDAMLMDLFDAANIRIQWVNDYQVRTEGFPGVPDTLPTAWPLTVEFMMYAPGTVVLGQGMRLDLGVVRDSILNETNDHTAEWMEECWLIFQPGHEIRRLTVNICPDGTTGAADLTACGV